MNLTKEPVKKSQLAEKLGSFKCVANTASSRYLKGKWTENCVTAYCTANFTTPAGSDELITRANSIKALEYLTSDEVTVRDQESSNFVIGDYNKTQISIKNGPVDLASAVTCHCSILLMQLCI